MCAWWGKRDIREVAICSSVGPVLEVLNSINEGKDWATHRDELRRCFSPNKTRVHAADLLSNFQKQHAKENLRSFIHQYTKMHRQATGLKPEQDYDLITQSGVPQANKEDPDCQQNH